MGCCHASRDPEVSYPCYPRPIHSYRLLPVDAIMQHLFLEWLSCVYNHATVHAHLGRHLQLWHPRRSLRYDGLCLPHAYHVCPRASMRRLLAARLGYMFPSFHVHGCEWLCPVCGQGMDVCELWHVVCRCRAPAMLALRAVSPELFRMASVPQLNAYMAGSEVLRVVLRLCGEYARLASGVSGVES